MSDTPNHRFFVCYLSIRIEKYGNIYLKAAHLIKKYDVFA
jgi:hypothetical protein